MDATFDESRSRNDAAPAAGAAGATRRTAGSADVAHVAAAIALARDRRFAQLEAAIGVLLGEEIRIVRASRETGSRFASDDGALTPRLRAVAELIVDGRSDKEIAGALGLSVATARTYVSRLCRVLGVSGRGGVLRWARAEPS